MERARARWNPLRGYSEWIPSDVVPSKTQNPGKQRPGLHVKEAACIKLL